MLMSFTASSFTVMLLRVAKAFVTRRVTFVFSSCPSSSGAVSGSGNSCMQDRQANAAIRV